MLNFGISRWDRFFLFWSTIGMFNALIIFFRVDLNTDHMGIGLTSGDQRSILSWAYIDKIYAVDIRKFVKDGVEIYQETFVWVIYCGLNFALSFMLG